MKSMVVTITKKLYHYDARGNDDSEIVSIVEAQLVEKVARA